MKASLHNYHQSPRKVRLVADLVRGKTVAQAKDALAFMPQKSAPDVEKLLNSAVANAQVKGLSAENLFVKMIQVNKGIAMRRFKPMARGRAAQFRKTMSIVTLELGEIAGAKKASAKKQDAETPAAEKPAKKPAAKKAAKKATK